jgi:hypothetical protein
MDYCNIRAASAHVCPINSQNFKIPFGKQEKNISRRRRAGPKVTSKFQKLLFHPCRVKELLNFTLSMARVNQVCGMLPVPEDNLSSMIYLSSNGLSGPKRMLYPKQ